MPLKFPGLGFDVSHHNVDSRGRPVDWARALAAGFRFVLVKATDGAAFRDSQFLRSVEGARNAGLSVGAYHFLRPGAQADAQAASFLHQVGLAGGAGVFDIGAAVDPGAWDRIPKAERGDKVRNWMAGVRDQFPLPMVYCIPGWWGRTIGKDEDLGEYPLWAASPSGEPKLAGSPWKKFALWQYAFHGTVDGVGFKNVDLDRAPVG